MKPGGNPSSCFPPFPAQIFEVSPVNPATQVKGGVTNVWGLPNTKWILPSSKAGVQWAEEAKGCPEEEMVLDKVRGKVRETMTASILQTYIGFMITSWSWLIAKDPWKFYFSCMGISWNFHGNS